MNDKDEYNSPTNKDRIFVPESPPIDDDHEFIPYTPVNGDNIITNTQLELSLNDNNIIGDEESETYNIQHAETQLTGLREAEYNEGGKYRINKSPQSSLSKRKRSREDNNTNVKNRDISDDYDPETISQMELIISKLSILLIYTPISSRKAAMVRCINDSFHGEALENIEIHFSNLTEIKDIEGKGVTAVIKAFEKSYDYYGGRDLRIKDKYRDSTENDLKSEIFTNKKQSSIDTDIGGAWGDVVNGMEEILATVKARMASSSEEHNLNRQRFDKLKEENDMMQREIERLKKSIKDYEHGYEMMSRAFNNSKQQINQHENKNDII